MFPAELESTTFRSRNGEFGWTRADSSRSRCPEGAGNGSSRRRAVVGPRRCHRLVPRASEIWPTCRLSLGDKIGGLGKPGQTLSSAVLRTRLPPSSGFRPQRICHLTLQGEFLQSHLGFRCGVREAREKALVESARNACMLPAALGSAPALCFTKPGGF